MISKGWTRAAIVAVGSALLLAAAGAASAHDRMQRLKEHLDLTETQVTAMREVFAEDTAAQRQIFQNLRQGQGELRQLALNGAEEAVLQEKTAQLGVLMTQALQLRVQRLQKMASILTPEQRAKYAQLRDGGPRMMKGRPRHS